MVIDASQIGVEYPETLGVVYASPLPVGDLSVLSTSATQSLRQRIFARHVYAAGCDLDGVACLRYPYTKQLVFFVYVCGDCGRGIVAPPGGKALRVRLEAHECGEGRSVPNGEA